MEFLEVTGLEDIELIDSIDANNTGIMIAYLSPHFKEEDKDKFARLVKQKTNYSVIFVYNEPDF